MIPSPLAPIAKSVLLLGAGNAHLRFVKMFGMAPWPGVAVTLVCESPTIPYSAMVPGHVAGDYPRDDVTIDLVRLCRSCGVRFLTAPAIAIDAKRRTVTFEGRPKLSYDVLSLGVGSLPACPPGLEEGDASWRMRPLGKLISRLEALDRDLRKAPRPFHLVVVGGGASGCELALAIRKRLKAVAELKVTLLQGNARLVPEFPEKASRILAKRMQEEGIEFRVAARVSAGDAKSLVVGGDRMPYDAVLWATNAAPPPVLATAGLPVDAGGFLRVADTLQSVGDPAVFGTGDCIAFDSRPDLPKNGVFAVREGGTLFENVLRFLTNRPLEPFVPQKYCLGLLNTADGEALFRYGPVVWKGKRARRLKNKLDREWMDQFTKFAPMKPAGAEEAPEMRCGGCGSKISADVLSPVLKRLDVGDDARILFGARAGEDAAVHRMRPELFSKDPAKLVEVQTVDYFKSFTDDPYLFGRIAALHAVSDIHAMNARPFSALAIATLPYARGPVQETMLDELLSGAVRSLRDVGVILTGGHTTEGPDLAIGFSVTGYGEEGNLFLKGALQAGETLILTKPLGSGALLAAWMRGACRAEWYERLIAGLLQPNARAAEIFGRFGVRACTDVTGFGLAGHLLEMLDASRAGARIDAANVPLYPGFAEVVKSGIVSTLHQDNAKTACRVSAADPPAWLFDPQTSGGLLASVKPDSVPDLLHELMEAGYASAAAIGEVVPGPPVAIELRA